MHAMGLANKLKAAFGAAPDTAAPAYAAAVRAARAETWFTAAAVPDTVDGRFDALALVLALTVIRAQGQREAAFEAALIDRFAADMDASFREMGVGDLSISKAVGQAVGALGGRITAYRDGLADPAALDEALTRNLYRGWAPSAAALAAARAETVRLARRLETAPWDAILAGRW